MPGSSSSAWSSARGFDVGAVTGRPRSVSGFSSEQASASASVGRLRRGERVDGGLLDAGRRARAQVVRRLQALLPGVEVHRRELADGRRCSMNRLSDWLWSMNGAAVGGHVDQRPHAAAPTRCGTARGRSAGSSAMSCTEPSARLIASRICLGPQAERLQLARPGSVLTWRKSPDSVSRLNRFDTCGSMHS